MRLYQPKKGYRYTSDTIFLWNFIRSSGVRKADVASQDTSRALGCGAEFKDATDGGFNAQFCASDFAGGEAKFFAEDCAFRKEESYVANHSVGNDRDFGSKGCAELKAEFKMKFQAAAKIPKKIPRRKRQNRKKKTITARAKNSRPRTIC